MREKTPDEVEDRVLRMLEAGFKQWEVSEIMGIAKSTVSRIAIRRGFAQPKKSWKPSNETMKWLEENWPPEIPEHLYKPKQKKRRHTNFRTPYNYPRMWHD